MQIITDLVMKHPFKCFKIKVQALSKGSLLNLKELHLITYSESNFCYLMNQILRWFVFSVTLLFRVHCESIYSKFYFYLVPKSKTTPRGSFVFHLCLFWGEISEPAKFLNMQSWTLSYGAYNKQPCQEICETSILLFSESILGSFVIAAPCGCISKCFITCWDLS